MADRSRIEWTDATWNPVVGCSHVSRGCDHCYAARMASRQLPAMVKRYGGLADRGRWTGEVRVHDDLFDVPKRWRKPRRIFVCSMGDLFHDAVPADALARVFDVIRECPQHTFFLLTKRPWRMRQFINARGGAPDNTIVGVSVDDAEDLRVPILLSTHHPRRFISAEPLLGPLSPPLYGISWVVTGVETGPRARRCDPQWLRGLRDRCAAWSVPFMLKRSYDGSQELDGVTHLEGPWGEP